MYSLKMCFLRAKTIQFLALLFCNERVIVRLWRKIRGSSEEKYVTSESKHRGKIFALLTDWINSEKIYHVRKSWLNNLGSMLCIKKTVSSVLPIRSKILVSKKKKSFIPRRYKGLFLGSLDSGDRHEYSGGRLSVDRLERSYPLLNIAR